VMNSNLRNRRNLIGHLTSLFSLVGLGSLMTGSAMARKSPAPDAVRKLDRDGKPADGKQMITPLIIHNGLIYIAGQGANSNGPVGKDDIESHTTKVMENVKQLVETGGGTMDSILQLTVYLAYLQNIVSPWRAGANYRCRCGTAWEIFYRNQLHCCHRAQVKLQPALEAPLAH